MITVQKTVEITADRKLKIDVELPPDTPLGQAELTLSVRPQSESPQKKPRTSLADWAEENAEHWGDQISSTDVEGFTGRRF